MDNSAGGSEQLSDQQRGLSARAEVCGFRTDGLSCRPGVEEPFDEE